MSRQRLHPPALVAECLQYLRVGELSGGVLLDLTMGTAGHSLAMLAANPNVRVVGFDRDSASLELAARRLDEGGFSGRYRLVQADYGALAEHLANSESSQVAGVLLDAGCSLWQLDDPARGMSFRLGGPLDMRFDVRQTQTAATVVNQWTTEELAELFINYGEPPARARTVALALAQLRSQQPLQTTDALLKCVQAALRRTPGHAMQQVQTHLLASLRSAVNSELSSLRLGLIAAIQTLRPGGRLVVLSYHSAEDAQVKAVFAEFADARAARAPRQSPFGPLVKLITPKPVIPTKREIKANPRARSAKLRCVERLAPSGDS